MPTPRVRPQTAAVSAAAQKEVPLEEEDSTAADPVAAAVAVALAGIVDQ